VKGLLLLRALALQPPLVFFLEALRFGHEGLDFVPHGLVQEIHPDGPVVARSWPRGTVAVHCRTAMVKVPMDGPISTMAAAHDPEIGVPA